MPPPFFESWHLLQKSWHLLQFHKQQNGQPCDHPLLLTAKLPSRAHHTGNMSYKRQCKYTKYLAYMRIEMNI
nr:MAG TPA: hypothetical protein [Caudoviricetes sp.]